MTRFIALALAFGLAVVPSTAALAQAAAPIGYWTTPDNGERLLVEADTSCSFEANGGTGFAGNCVWQSTSRGGILALYYETARGLAPVYWSVVWVDDNHITVNGDPFTRRQ
jgi:hypothetical protein